jgi:hypothetical protein
VDNETSLGVSADGMGSVFVSGWTNGDLDGINAGGVDAYVSKLNSLGVIQWSRQLGSIGNEYNRDVFADGLGNVYIAGYTNGNLDGVNAGADDAYLSKFDSSGSPQWTRQFGTVDFDRNYGGSSDGLGNVFVAGFTNGDLSGVNAGSDDVFVSKYDSSGNHQWTEQLGTPTSDWGRDVAADSFGNVYVVGNTNGDLGGVNAGNWDVFLSKYDTAGTLLWTTQYGSSSSDYGQRVSTDDLGNVFVAGNTYGDLDGVNAGSSDAFVSKFNSVGNLLWTEQFGSSSDDRSESVSADGFGNVYVSGNTNGDLNGANAGESDAFVAMFDSTGALIWNKQLGTVGSDYSFGVSADGSGKVYISGSTEGDLAGIGSGGFDAYVTKFVPEPSTFGLLAFGVLGLLTHRPRQRSYPCEIRSGRA